MCSVFTFVQYIYKLTKVEKKKRADVKMPVKLNHIILTLSQTSPGFLVSAVQIF